MRLNHTMQVESIYELLTEIFKERKKKNSRYSLRSFARDLGLHVSQLTHILKNRKGLSAANIIRICALLKLTPEATQKFVAVQIATPAKKAKRTSPGPKQTYQILNSEELELISDWRCFAIIEYLSIDPHLRNLDELAKSIGLTLPQVRQKVLILQKLGMMEKKESGYHRSQPNFTTTENEANEQIHRLHQQINGLAAEKLSLSVDERDYSFLIFCTNKERIAKAQQKILKFRRGLLEFLEQGRPEDIYCVNINLFPIHHEPE